MNDVVGSNDVSGLNTNPTSSVSPTEFESTAYAQAVEYLYGRIDYERQATHSGPPVFRLDRTAELFTKLGLSRYLHPSYRVNGSDDQAAATPLVHIAGTKGKGSTSTMVSSILTSAGNRVGLYTSPHLTHLNERFRIDGVPCTDQQLVDLVGCVRPVVEAMDARGQCVSFFELTTAMAVLYFHQQRCDAIVLEVGLGGRLDSTNVCQSSVTAVTSIGLDHQHVLGETVQEIAAEKAGIFKSGVPAVCGVRDPDARQVVHEIAKQRQCELFQFQCDYQAEDIVETEAGIQFRYRTEGSIAASQLDVRLPLIGNHQADNASAAITICRLLDQATQNSLPLLKHRVDQAAIEKGLVTVCCDGRLECFQLKDHGTRLVLDTAHNPDSVGALCRAVRSRIQSDRDEVIFRQPVVVVFGTSRDKDVASMAAQLATIADQVIGTQYCTNPRALSVDAVVSAFRDAGVRPENLQAELMPDSALQLALGHAAGGTVIVCGSFYLAGELRPTMIRMAAPEAGLDRETTTGLLARS
ncbi:bifunctional folylpolyglutamate synthase/dihydrofolate synthase [Rhodopirellula sp. MGV]|uniref:bifunctional folylpolyglutamate synthase/dihydrofolate synthase n=1 Tax=Rhodopirellula sp. MGV TaxID=2023130 RepID=UPI000BD3D411|nr:folylpolyglutamate synthase/dihydrofolate synthase family protein [Rhodopirellula sp. MGV]OYP38384.1 hypothetical protein CGZ80_02235 [Rhodopirellula sp. MGV]